MFASPWVHQSFHNTNPTVRESGTGASPLSACLDLDGQLRTYRVGQAAKATTPKERHRVAEMVVRIEASIADPACFAIASPRTPGLRATSR